MPLTCTTTSLWQSKTARVTTLLGLCQSAWGATDTLIYNRHPEDTMDVPSKGAAPVTLL